MNALYTPHISEGHNMRSWTCVENVCISRAKIMVVDYIQLEGSDPHVEHVKGAVATLGVKNMMKLAGVILSTIQVQLEDYANWLLDKNKKERVYKVLEEYTELYNKMKDILLSGLDDI